MSHPSMNYLDEHQLTALAREIAMNIYDITTIFEHFGIDETEYYEITKIPFFQQVKEQYTIEWNSALSTEARLKIKNLAMAEAVLPTLGLRALDRKEPFQGPIDFYKTCLKTGGFGEQKTAGGAGSERFVITINLGADEEGKPVIEHYDKPLAINEPVVNGFEKQLVVDRSPPVYEKGAPNSVTDEPLTPAQAAALESLMEIDGD
jgi:hypothetical protein